MPLQVNSDSPRSQRLSALRTQVKDLAKDQEIADLTAKLAKGLPKQAGSSVLKVSQTSAASAVLSLGFVSMHEGCVGVFLGSCGT